LLQREFKIERHSHSLLGSIIRLRQTSENVQRERNDYGSVTTPFSGLQDRFEVIYGEPGKKRTGIVSASIIV
jgi:hypothetical protein